MTRDIAEGIVDNLILLAIFVVGIPVCMIETIVVGIREMMESLRR